MNEQEAEKMQQERARRSLLIRMVQREESYRLVRLQREREALRRKRP